MKRLLILAALVVSAIALLPDFSSAANYDGKWSVLIVTEQGNCDRAYRYPLKIENGMVDYGGTKDFQVDGRVQGNGAVTVRVARGNQAAEGTGRLSGKFGQGTWRSPSGGCSGTWKADKRG